ncbi:MULTISPECIES: hypothetical protein [unclassified Halomonas]|uniref:hypothetical protein n=1 Tax=unclassified Halomonas TaxID=2609666 RepID=UPI000AC0B3E4|nr:MULTISPECIES: hypothetical protein [unclassified Halomonas]MBT2785281.1 hypothetical protein [Halomonas sp. ISL-106]MBT2799302.1 hypothetical protein [Halomonas sp. ISL-104]
MSEIVCPHCHGEVSHGARVCRGCQAEIEYGCPPMLFVVLVIFSVYLGYKTSEALPESLSFAGWVVGVGGIILGGVLLTKAFKKRVNFKRVYKTR